MKKLLFVIAFCTIFAVTSLAQVKISGGVLGGLNLANVTVDPEPAGVTFDNLTGFGFGGVLNFGFSGGFAVKVEPMYLQKGNKYSGSGFEGKTKGAYFEVPVLLIYSFGAGEVQPYFLAGPSIGFVLSAKDEFTFGGTTTETDIKDDIKSTDFGVIFGAGVSIPAGNNSFFIEGRYSLGLSDINNVSGSTTKIKTTGIQIFAGITFPFGN